MDHLFRHQYGKMVAILSRFFGLAHLETIEDAVQDTFIRATLQWRNHIPDNPEAWLIQAAKNRAIDILRKLKADQNRYEKISSGSSAFQMGDLFLDHEVEDSQLRMIFVACHPALNSDEQIAFALKTISGFSMKEIAAALLQKDETIKKRLTRARKSIIEKDIKLEYPSKHEVNGRLLRVMEVIYLTFNEGFHSTNKNHLIRQDLCGEAMRLCKLLLKKDEFRSGTLYALFALMCFHAARLEARIGTDNEIINLEDQDRSKWHMPLVFLGNDAMNNAMNYDQPLSTYHYEAAIAAEHLRAPSFELTDWGKILQWYEALDLLHPTPSNKLSMALVHLQLKQFKEALDLLESIKPEQLSQRSYLYYGAFAKYHELLGDKVLALNYLNQAIDFVSNEQEKEYLNKKISKLS